MVYSCTNFIHIQIHTSSHYSGYTRMEGLRCVSCVPIVPAIIGSVQVTLCVATSNGLFSAKRPFSLSIAVMHSDFSYSTSPILWEALRTGEMFTFSLNIEFRNIIVHFPQLTRSRCLHPCALFPTHLVRACSSKKWDDFDRWSFCAFCPHTYSSPAVICHGSVAFIFAYSISAGERIQRTFIRVVRYHNKLITVICRLWVYWNIRTWYESVSVFP